MNNLLVIPSIDIKDGKTLRVVEEIPEINCSAYGDDPIKMGLIWRAENAKCIHLVDFNASQDYSKINHPVIEEICDSLVIPVQLGGGIRTFEDAKEAMELGVYRLVIGSMAYNNPEDFKKCVEHFGPSRISAAIDVFNNEVVVHSREKNTGFPVLEYAGKLRSYGIERLVVTDINTNGTCDGPNIELSKSIAENSGLRVTIAGGVGGLKDINLIKNHLNSGIDSVIIGRALYENKFQCQRIWRLAENGLFNGD